MTEDTTIGKDDHKGDPSLEYSTYCVLAQVPNGLCSDDTVKITLFGKITVNHIIS